MSHCQSKACGQGQSQLGRGHSGLCTWGECALLKATKVMISHSPLCTRHTREHQLYPQLPRTSGSQESHVYRRDWVRVPAWPLTDQSCGEPCDLSKLTWELEVTIQSSLRSSWVRWSIQVGRCHRMCHKERCSFCRTSGTPQFGTVFQGFTSN